MVLHPIRAGESLNNLPAHIPLRDSRSLSFKDNTWKIVNCFSNLALINVLWLYYYDHYRLLFLELLPCVKQHYIPYTHYLIFSAYQPSKLDKYLFYSCAECHFERITGSPFYWLYLDDLGFKLRSVSLPGLGFFFLLSHTCLSFLFAEICMFNYRLPSTRAYLFMWFAFTFHNPEGLLGGNVILCN